VSLHSTQPANDRRPREKTDEQAGQHRAAAPEGQVAEEVEDLKFFGKRGKQIIQHGVAIPLP
jgi:hypothetical protein